ncbi:MULTISPECIES: ABC transporter ATP-binding protein [Segatella]|jgi:ABC-2 type transport system ATP-binding protein|uniref:BhtF n=2 Tax=Segatella TaxID=2974251 RepID=D8E0P6_9BACT|nr:MULTISPECIES: ABC transporter ATP-binding protein [Segatella]EFI70737.1 BhtF [Segatella baroniae B14]UKK79356.1 ABC transporter ATP-binding protein [Segatella baroniae B14]SEA45538.1 ABC-2 type transport system ATP-binding protein [Segatella bryantii]SER09282.1 ABC-2 type transport system ATP-binding protein [Segatella baroniae B14]GJG28323.1 hypothetical protein PRRU23_20230 [Segatella bryantii]
MIELKHIKKKYDTSYVIEDISLTLEPGKIYGFMGENGAGKSTLFRCLSGLEKYEGEIIIPSSTDIGFLSDTLYFYPLITGNEFVKFCLEAGKIKYTQQDIDHLNQIFKLPLNRFPTKYSLGMKKRLMLMIMMLRDSNLYILDEPFNGLDLTGVVVLKKWLKKIGAQQKTVVLSSHIISSLTDICDVIFYIHNGKIIKTYSGNISPDQIEKDLLEQVNVII